jgi:hypothetical protein
MGTSYRFLIGDSTAAGQEFVYVSGTKPLKIAGKAVFTPRFPRVKPRFAGTPNNRGFYSFSAKKS